MSVELAGGDVAGHLDRIAHAVGEHPPEQEGQTDRCAKADQQADQQGCRGVAIGAAGGVGRGLGLAIVLGDQGDDVVHHLVVQGAGLAGESIDGVVVQVELQHFVDGLVGGAGLLPVGDQTVVDGLFLRAADLGRILGQDLVHLLLQRNLARGRFLLQRIAAADQALVGRVAVLAENAAHFAAGAHARHHLRRHILGHAIERVKTAVGGHALDQHQRQHDAERQHQFGHHLQIFNPLHERVSHNSEGDDKGQKTANAAAPDRVHGSSTAAQWLT
ncbi:hypothetical protein NB689_001571 [Xanthomonas sacchari]|nr:hypothetical protein [Xanthomonas sacchari]